MPYSLELNGHFLCVRYFGFLTREDVLGAIDQVGKLPEIDKVTRTLSDLRDVTAHNINMEVSYLAAIFGEALSLTMNQNGRTAVVAARKDLLALANFYAKLNEQMTNWPTQVFTGVAEAEAWLSE